MPAIVFLTILTKGRLVPADDNGGYAVGIKVGGSSSVRILEGYTITVVARNGRVHHDGVVADDESDVEIETNNRISVTHLRL